MTRFMHIDRSASPRRSRTLLLAALATTALSTIAMADKKEPHADIWLRPEAGVLRTGSISEGTPGDPIELNERVFAAEFGEDPKFPFAAFEPGIQSLPGDDTADGVFTFMVPGPLLAWDGRGLASTDATMSIGFGPELVTTGEVSVDGFSVATQPSGLLHDHYDFFLNGADGADPEVGVYVLPLRFGGPTPETLESATVWIVFNGGADEETHDAVIRYAELYLACGIDLDGSGSVGASDLALLLGAWGTVNAAADLDQSGQVDASDLAFLLGAWGTTCE